MTLSHLTKLTAISIPLLFLQTGCETTAAMAEAPPAAQLQTSSSEPIKPLLVADTLTTAQVEIERPQQVEVDVHASKFTFVAIGDLPYNDDQEYFLNKYKKGIAPSLKAKDKNRDLPFIVHLGDFKRGGKDPCPGVWLQKHYKWMRKAPAPVFYTPGDNDWTDCDRNEDAPEDPLFRLAEIRQLFYDPIPQQAKIPTAMKPRWQLSQPENAQWEFENVVFATIHTVGGNNGRVNCTKAEVKKCIKITSATKRKKCEDDIRKQCEKQKEPIHDSADARDKANIDWIYDVFKLDRSVPGKPVSKLTANAVVIATQADPLDTKLTGDCTTPYRGDCNGFKSTLDAFIEAAEAFGRHVLLIHGDTSPYCLDKDFKAKWNGKDDSDKVTKIWRLNAAADFSLIDAVEVVVDTSGATPFQATGLLSKLKPAKGCWVP